MGETARRVKGGACPSEKEKIPKCIEKAKTPLVRGSRPCRKTGGGK